MRGYLLFFNVFADTEPDGKKVASGSGESKAV